MTIVNVTRAISNAEDRPAGLDPVYVSALFDDRASPGVCIARMSDGRGFRLRGTYAELKATLGVNCVEFDRWRPTVAVMESGEFGEDDGLDPHPAPAAAIPATDKIAVNPRWVSAILGGESGACILRLPDGRGVYVAGTFAEVRDAIDPTPPAVH